MPIDPNDLRTGGALQGAVAASLVRHRDSAAELAPGAQVGIYRVRRELGRGGMAIVYLAERADGEYEQQVALKWILQAQPDAASEALFRRERQALADLRHPHIARLLDGGRTAEGRPWFAMELIDGDPLDRHCVQAALPLPQRLWLFQQICAAVAFAHARGVIHRDIKPSNVLVDADGSAKLLDFGIAQLLGQDDVLAARAYTPGFASPEQVRGETLTVASDVYQLGRLLASLLSRDVAEQTTLGIATSELPHSGDAFDLPLPQQVPADLGSIVRKACAYEATQRYATADALASDVRAFLERRPVAARPRRGAYVATRYLQRHPVAVTLGALALATLVGVSTWFSLRLRDERDLAQQQRDIAQKERDAAQQARASAEAINRFLNEDVLDAANPLRRAPGAPDVTVRQALDAAEARVDQRFGEQPDVAMNVLTTLGVLRYEFGDDAQAMALYDRALAAGKNLPLEHPARLDLRSERAALLITMQDFERATTELESLLEDASNHLDPGDARRFEWELRLIEARSRQGIDPGHVGQLRDLRQRIEHALGKPNALAGEASLLAANAMIFSGKPDQALADAEYAHQALHATLGPDHPSTLKALTAVAHGRRAQGHDDEAVAAMRKAHTLQVARYGPDAGDSKFLQNELAFTLSALGRQSEAEPLFVDLVERRAREADANPTLYLQALGNLATTRVRQGRTAEALADYERAATFMRGASQVLPQVSTNIQRGRGDALRELKRYDEAAIAYDAAARAAETLPENDARRFALQGSRAGLLLAQGRTDEGRLMLDQSIVALQANVPGSHPVLKALLEARARLDAPEHP